MATTTTRRPASRRRSSSRYAKSRRRGARRRPPREPRFAGLREQLRAQLEAHATDALAVALAVAGIITGLAVCVHFAGPFGRALDTGSGAVLGKGRFFLPFALFGGAIALVVEPAADEDDEEVERRGVRVGVGVTVVLLAAIGLLHLAAGRPDSQSFTKLRQAGGVLGALVAGPLAAALGPFGAGIVLVALFVFGSLLIAHVGLREAIRGLGAGARFVGSTITQLFELNSDDTEEAESDTTSPSAATPESAPLGSAVAAANRRPAFFDQSLFEDEEEEEEEEEEEDDDEEYELDEEDEEEEEEEDEEEDEEEEDEDEEDEEDEDGIDLVVEERKVRPTWKLPPPTCSSEGVASRSISGSSTRVARSSRRRCTSSVSTRASSARPSARPSPATSWSSLRA